MMYPKFLRLFVFFAVFTLLSHASFSQSTIAWADSCFNNSFKARMTLPEKNTFSKILNVHPYIGGDIMATGVVYPQYPGYKRQVYGLVMRLTREGQIRWVKFITYSLDPEHTSEIWLSNSAIAENNDIVCLLHGKIIRISPAGDITWTRELMPQTGAGWGTSWEQIIKTSDNGFLAIGIGGNSSATIVLKLNDQGVVQWSKELDGGNYNFGQSVTEGPDAYYIMGYIFGSPQGEEVFVRKVDKTGKEIWTKSLHKTLADGRFYLREVYNMITYKDGLLNLTGHSRVNSGFPEIQATLTMSADDGKFIGARRIVNKEISVAPGLFRNNNFEISTQTGVQFPHFGDLYLYRLDAQSNPAWAWKYQLQGKNWVDDMAVLSDSSVVLGGHGQTSQFNADGQAQIIKTNRMGKMGDCTSLPFQIEVSHFTENITPMSLFERTITRIDNDPFTLVLFDGRGFNWNLSCSTTVQCKMSKIMGKANPCKGMPAMYSVVTEGNCGNPVVFTASPGVTLEVLPGNAVKFLDSKEEKVKLYASMQTDCGILSDSIEINWVEAPGPVNLGEDTLICPGNQLQLFAGSGYDSYLWQDGSIHPTYMATNPGTYKVQVKDACGNEYSDEIKVNDFRPVPPPLGPDRIKCNNDTLHLAFGYHNPAPVVVNPSRDTTCILRAIAEYGCIVFDTINVTVLYSPGINLGPDLQFCEGTTAVLDAGGSFEHYQWNTSATSQSLVISDAGQYSVTAEYSNGCKVSDTIIAKLLVKPEINIHQYSGICEGQPRKLSPGPGFNRYKWQDGTTDEIFFAASKGKYWVEVTDANRCTGSDTSILDKYIPPPASFLGPDTAMCSYESVLLKSSREFRYYSWNTGSNGQNISVTHPGKYWLEVTDQFNCIGRDTIVILPKECLTGFFMPNAFTPNNDGVNDQIKPIIAGRITAYEFFIYNRFGQLVFHTSNITEGWNGVMRGYLQDGGNYVWKCRYRLDGKKPTVNKGNFLLIR